MRIPSYLWYENTHISIHPTQIPGTTAFLNKLGATTVLGGKSNNSSWEVRVLTKVA
jgi:hypothetical protein